MILTTIDGMQYYVYAALSVTDYGEYREVSFLRGGVEIYIQVHESLGYFSKQLAIFGKIGVNPWFVESIVDCDGIQNIYYCNRCMKVTATFNEVMEALNKCKKL